MFDVKATRAWWDFFHRFSLIYTGANFDYILVLGINLLQCYQCQDDASNFIKTIGAHKTPFEKVHILHNYVNRKLKKKIFDISETRQYASDVLEGEKANWNKLLQYYFDLLFLMVNYLEDKHLNDLKEFTAYIYKSINLSKTIPGLSVSVIYSGKFDREDLKMQVYDYYRSMLTSINMSNVNNKRGRFIMIENPQMQIKNFSQIFGTVPKKIKTCKSCAKKHALWLEHHNTPKTMQKKIGENIYKKPPQRIDIKSKSKNLTNNLNPEINKSEINKSENNKSEINKSENKLIKNKNLITLKNKIKQQNESVQNKSVQTQSIKVTENKVVPSIITIKPRITPNNNNNNNNNNNKSDKKISETKETVVRKKVVPVVKKPRRIDDKPKRKIIFQRSRIIRYPQKRVPAKGIAKKK
tara:strand:+ start:1302 stop:2534 length:1233 start_codon:yes stop_codon:yes gene_type:complete